MDFVLQSAKLSFVLLLLLGFVLLRQGLSYVPLADMEIYM